MYAHRSTITIAPTRGGSAAPFYRPGGSRRIEREAGGEGRHPDRAKIASYGDEGKTRAPRTEWVAAN